MSMKNPKVGQWVTVDGHKSKGAAKIECVGEIAGVRLDRKVAGFKWWGPEELTAVPPDEARALAKQEKKP